MCGILYAKKTNKNDTWKAILKRYHLQRTRGTEGFGFIAIDKGIIKGVYRAEDEKTIIEMLEKQECDEILFHHRFPTSTPNFIEATHPILVSHESLEYDYYVVHNGIITNCDDLKETFEKKGFEYTTKIIKKYETSLNVYTEEMFNDTESFAIDFALSIEKGQPMQSRGAIAFIALQVEKGNNNVTSMYYGKNDGNPLKIEKREDFFSITSESGTPIESNVLYRYDVATGKTHQYIKEIGYYFLSPTRYGYTGYTGYTSEAKGIADDIDDDYPYEDIRNLYLMEDIESGLYQGNEETILYDYACAIDDMWDSGDTEGAEELEKELKKIKREFVKQGYNDNSFFV